MAMEKSIKKIRYFFTLILAIVCGYFVYMGVVPTGRITYENTFDDENFFIRKLTPAERVQKPADGIQKIVGQPVYFSLYTPRTFDSAVMTFKFRNKTSFPLIEAGILSDKKIWRYRMSPIENKTLDEMSAKWDVSVTGNLSLYQKEKKYASVAEFMAAPPDLSTVAVYNAAFYPDFRMSDYVQSDALETLGSGPLRGDYQFYAYTRNEGLYFSFKIHDLNLNKDEDGIEVIVSSKDNEIKRVTLADDGNREDNGRASVARELDVIIPDLSEGAYKIEFRAGSDIITDQITTVQKKIVFLNKLWLMGDKPTDDLCCDSYRLTAQTANPAALQTILVSDQEAGGNASFRRLKLDETYKQYSLALDGKLKKIHRSLGDVVISGDGLFSFTCDTFFRPVPRKLPDDPASAGGGLRYVLADYRPPAVTPDSWSVASATFDLKNAYRENGKYSLMLSIPGLRDSDDQSDYLEISSIRADLYGTDLMSKLKKIIRL